MLKPHKNNLYVLRVLIGKNTLTVVMELIYYENQCMSFFQSRALGFCSVGNVKAGQTSMMAATGLLKLESFVLSFFALTKRIGLILIHSSNEPRF